MKDKLSPQDSQTLSAYLDERLSSREKARLEARLQQQSDLRGELEALKQTRRMLQVLPKRRAPHNFTLSPAMAPKRPAPLLFPTFRFASALAGLLLVAAFIGQYALGGSFLPAQTAAPEAFTTSSNQAFAPAAPADTANKASVIIVWGTPTFPSLAVGIGGGRGGGPGDSAAAPAANNATLPSDTEPAAETSTPEAAVLPPENPAAATPTHAGKGGGPPLTAQQAETQTPTAAPTGETTQTPAAPAAAALAPVESSTPPAPSAGSQLSGNPILGIRPPGEQNTPEPTPEMPGQPPVSAPLPFWTWLEAGLGLAGAVLALAAFYFYRKEK